MRKIMGAIAALCLLAGCQTAGQLASAAPNIVNDLGLACKSAQQLLALPATQAGAGAVASSAAKLSSKVTTFCSRSQAAGPALTQALAAVNTAAAVLLGTGVAKP